MTDTPSPADLVKKWRTDPAYHSDRRDTVSGKTSLIVRGSSKVWEAAAAELEASLAAFSVEDAARDVIEPYFRGAKNKKVVAQLEAAISAALQSAFAAGQAATPDSPSAADTVN